MKDKDLLEKIRKRYRLMVDADHENRRLAMEDMKFINVPGHQWDLNMKRERGDRPCYEFNKLRVTCKRIINEMRANRPSGKVRGVEGTDKEIAETYEGLIRNIWNTSDGDTVIDYASEYQVGGGYGAWRITTDYSDDTAFEQDIKIEPIQNPYCLFADPSAKDVMKRDAMDFILTEKISKSSYEMKWPKAEKVDWESSEFADDEDWSTEDEEVRICEYWWKEPVDKEIWQLNDGKVIDAESDEAQDIPPEMVKRKRVVKTHKIMMCIASGEAILEGPIEWAGKELPFIVVYGEYMVVDGRTRWFGIGRFAKDAQRSYNVSRTSITETIAMAPQAKFWATPTQAEGHTDKWAEAHKKNFPFLLANPDPKQPGFPQRMGGADVPVALIQEAQLASEEIKAVTGIFSPDLGAGSVAKSGVQERERRAQGQLATFNYQDNLSKAIQRTWEILIDLIPHIYDTERELRILGADDSEDYVKINTFVPGPDGEPVKVNDLSVGRYDVTVTAGPSFTTKRQEAADTYQQLTQANPQIFSLAGDLIFKSMDLPYADEIAERLKVMLPPPIQDLINKDQAIPPEVQMMMQQAQQAMEMVQQQMQEVQMASQKTEMDKTEVEKLIANLKTEEAKFEAKIAKEMAKLAQKDARITKDQIEMERDGVVQQGLQAIEGERQMVNAELANEMAQSVQAIQEMAAQFNEHAMQILAQIQEEKYEKPKVVRIESRRENGKLIAVPIYEERDEDESVPAQ